MTINHDRFKFRVWDTLTNQFNNNAFCLSHYGTLFVYYHDGHPSHPITIHEKIQFPESKNFIIQMSTGLRDRKGVLIFEGDILKHYHSCECRIVRFSEGSFWANDHHLADLEDQEVIGNILQNPSLLEQK